jgi:hypothetical protein
MSESLLKNLKQVSRKMQDSKDLDYITVMEAMCEIEDLQAKYEQISKDYVALRNSYQGLVQKMTDAGNSKVAHLDWDDPNWQLGYITGVTEMIEIVKENENELH